ncbi:MAG: response regulator [Patescibacteria group bacterium]
MPKVLFIEDDTTICRALTEAAQNAAWISEQVPGNDIKRGRAVDLATANTKYDAIIVAGYFLEADIPYGHKVVEQIRKRKCTSIIVGTSGDPKREADFLKAGADAFVCRGSGVLNNPAGGFTKAAELFDQGFEAAKQTSNKKKENTKPTPDQT